MLFKILHGDASRISTEITPFHEGYCYVTHDGYMYIDMNIGTVAAPNNQRVKLNANEAESLLGYDITQILSASEVEIPTSKAVFDALAQKADKKHTHTAEDLQIDISGDLEAVKAEASAQDAVVLHEAQAYTDAALQVANDYIDEQMSDLTSTVETNYDETIIALSVDGTTVTYIKGDGSVHTFETQDTNTTYSLGTDSVTGLTKLYATTGNAEDGTMTQKAIKTELDKKVGVTMDDANHTLIFTK